MANFSRLIDLSETLNENPKEILKQAMQSESLVVAKVPLCDIYLLARRPISTATDLENRITKKVNGAHWLVLTHSDIEDIFEYGQVDIDEFRTLAYERGDEGVFQENAWQAASSLAKSMKMHRLTPLLSDFFSWKDSIFIFSKKTFNSQDDAQKNRIRATFAIRDLFIESKVKKLFPKTTPKIDVPLDTKKETGITNTDKPQWMSENLHILNTTSKKYFTEDTKMAGLTPNIREKIRAELQTKLRNKGKEYGKDKIKDSLDFLIPDNLRPRRIIDALKNVPMDTIHSSPPLSSILKIMNKVAEELWENHITRGKGYPDLRTTENLAIDAYGIGAKAAKCFASMITPDEIKNN